MFTAEIIKNDLKIIVQEILEKEISDLSFEDDFYALGLDSIDRIRMLVEIEKKYDIEIEDDEDYSEENFANIDTVTKIVQKYL